jgi:hypothetical protein
LVTADWDAARAETPGTPYQGAAGSRHFLREKKTAASKVGLKRYLSPFIENRAETVTVKSEAPPVVLSKFSKQRFALFTVA